MIGGCRVSNPEVDLVAVNDRPIVAAPQAACRGRSVRLASVDARRSGNGRQRLRRRVLARGTRMAPRSPPNPAPGILRDWGSLDPRRTAPTLLGHVCDWPRARTGAAETASRPRTVFSVGSLTAIIGPQAPQPPTTLSSSNQPGPAIPRGASQPSSRERLRAPLEHLSSIDREGSGRQDVDSEFALHVSDLREVRGKPTAGRSRLSSRSWVRERR